MGKRTTLKREARACIKLVDIFPKRRKRFYRPILIMLVSLFFSGTAQLNARAELSYYKYYFKEKQPLELDPSRIAILDRWEDDHGLCKKMYWKKGGAQINMFSYKFPLTKEVMLCFG